LIGAGRNAESACRGAFVKARSKFLVAGGGPTTHAD
jgi:hypothetical protein